MIAAAIAATTAVGQPASNSSPDLPFNWFDVVVIAILVFGIARGRHNGMSKECLPLLQWLVIVPVCAFLYPLAGQFYINTFHWDKTLSFVCGYATLGFVVMLFFGILRRLFAERMEKGDVFKNGEYYLGMVAGFVRVACVMLVAVALLNAPVYTDKDVKEYQAYAKKNFGGGMYSGDYFPTLQEIQEQVFKKSFLGPIIKDKLNMLLINLKPASPPPPSLGGPTPPPGK